MPSLWPAMVLKLWKSFRVGTFIWRFSTSMPRLDGLSMLASLRTQQSYLPCILMTAKLDSGIVKRAEELRVCDVLAKPFPLSRLSDAIRQVIG
jgi:FixJ family two-component response regulator